MIIEIAGVDRTVCILNRTLSIEDEAAGSPNTLQAVFYDYDDLGAPALDDEIIVTEGTTKLFAGRILQVTYNRLGSESTIDLVATDYTRDLDRWLVIENYQNQTDAQIVADIVARYTQGTGITATDVETGVTVQNIVFNYLPPSQALNKLTDLSAKVWYIDYDKNIHYIDYDTYTAPFNIDANNAQYSNLKISKDNTDLRNRVYVRGGTYLSDEVTISMVADGEQTVFNLPEKPHEITMTEGGAAKTIGIKNISAPADFDYLLNYQEKYIEKANGTAPAADTVMTFSFKYDIPVLVAVEARDSIEDIGTYEYAIFDTNLNNQDDARERAQAELTDYAKTLVDGSFETIVTGFQAGQYININLPALGINDDYLVQKVSARSIGGGNLTYTVQIVNTQKLGIINFLIKMLEQGKNLVSTNVDETVDELYQPDQQGITVTETLISNDLVEPPFVWDTAKWSLAEWTT